MKRVLLVKLDRIGDYILFRNLLHTIRNSLKYKDAHITVLGNPIWKSIAEAYDSDCADEWIWLENRDRCFRQSYENLLPGFIWRKRVREEQKKIKDKLRELRFDEVISLTVFRDSQLDWFVEGLAPVVTGAKAKSRMQTDSCYTDLIPVENGLFVYDMNCDFVGKLTESLCPPLELNNTIPVGNRKGLLVFAGASHPTRQMSVKKYQELVKHLLVRTHEDIIIAGGGREISFVKRVARKFSCPRVSIMAGSKTLAELVTVIQSCKCVIANDTGPMHIAAASGIPTVCIANGFSGEGAFWPYPDGRIKVVKPHCRTKKLSSFLPVRLIQQKRAIDSILLEDVLKNIPIAGI